jgi:capsular exopolysaccharide synthesis family protein
MSMSRFNNVNPPLPEVAIDVPMAAGFDVFRRNVMQVLWLRRWIVAITTVLCLLAGFFYAMTATPIYRASATLYVQQSQPKMFVDMGGMVQGSNYLQTQTAVILSRQIMDKVVAMPEVSNLSIIRGQKDPVGFLRGAVTAAVGRKDDVITVACELPSAEEAQTIVNGVVTAFQLYHQSLQKESATEMLKLIRDQKDSYDKDIQTKYGERQKFQRENASLSLGITGGNSIYERLNDLSRSLTQSQMEALEAESTYKSTAEMINDPVKIAQLMSSPQFRGGENAELRRMIRDLQQQQVQLAERYMSGFTGLETVQLRIKQMQDALSNEDRRAAEAFLAELKVKWESALKRQEKIQEWLAEQQKEVLRLNQKQADFEIIQADISRLERNSASLDEQLKAIKLTEDTGALRVQSLDRAKADDNPVKPQRGLILGGALMGGLMLGMGLAYLRELTDHRLRSADEIKNTLNLPILGVVPHIQNLKTPSERGQMLFKDPMSDVSEAYRTIRTAVYFGQPNGVAKTLLVTSPAPGDGKSTLASNLAIAMAQAGNRILVLDCDFRKPTQHRIFELNRKVGLSNALAGEMPLAEVIVETEIAGLHVLPCGPIPANPSEILNSQTFADLLDELCEKYDHILIDSPPVMPVTDSRILAASCDATVLALRAEKSTRKGAVYSRDVLQSVGARLIGVVVNDVPRRRGVYGYYYTDAELYSYGYGTKRSSNGKQKSQLPATEEPKQLV